jgi:hypothetical protein
MNERILDYVIQFFKAEKNFFEFLFVLLAIAYLLSLPPCLPNTPFGGGGQVRHQDSK